MTFTSTTTRPNARRARIDAADALAVAWAGASLALFEGPVSLRKLRAGWIGFATDASVSRLVVGRLVWAAVLIPTCLVLWRVGARELARRRPGSGPNALTLEALPFLPFTLLWMGFSPGWGDVTQEPFSFAMLFLFLGVVVASSNVRLAAWHLRSNPSAIGRSVSSTSKKTLLLLYLGAALGLALWSGARAPIAVQPHWSSLADRSPYWPTRDYVVWWSCWLAVLSFPVLAVGPAFIDLGKPMAARTLTVVLSAAVVTSGLTVASRERARWDDRSIRFRGLAAGGEVSVEVPGKRAWIYPATDPKVATPLRTLVIHARVRPSLPAALWYRRSSPVVVRVLASGPGFEAELVNATLDPRSRAEDRRGFDLERRIEVAATTSVAITLETHSIDGHDALPVLASISVDGS